MAVHVQGEAGGSVSKIALHCLDVVPEAAMSEIMETDVWQADGGDDALILIPTANA